MKKTTFIGIFYFRDLTIDDDVKFFDLKILFILTAVCPESRKVLNKHLNDLIKYLSYILIKATENHLQHEELPPLYLNVSRNSFT